MSNRGPRVSSFVFQNSDMSVQQANQVWKGLREGIEEIQNGNASTLRFEELYRNAYTLVLHKHGELLYQGVERSIVAKLNATSKQVEQATNNKLLEVLVERWDNHKLIMTMIRDILMYMDKTYCGARSLTPVYDLGFQKFKEHVIKNKSANVTDRLRNELLDNIRKEREGEQIDIATIRNALRMLVDVEQDSRAKGESKEFYNEEFEKHFLQKTKEYYKGEAATFINENTCPDYLQKVERRIKEEEERAEKYLVLSTHPKLRRAVEEELIFRYTKILIENPKTGCSDMFSMKITDEDQIDDVCGKKITDLARMYKLFKRLKGDCESAGLPLLQTALYDYVKKEGIRIVSDVQNRKKPVKFVEEILTLRKTFHVILNQAFAEEPNKPDKHFAKKLKEAFEHVINLDMRAAQYLSLYVDGLLRNDIRKMNDGEVNQKLNDVMTIFKYLQDKDVFEDFYKQHLANRLLGAKATSDEYEKQMIGRLKNECGTQFVSKLEGMFKDMEQSRDLGQRWEQHIRETHLQGGSPSGGSDIELDCKVLTTGIWPFQHEEGCRLPRALQDKTAQFRRFYDNQHSGRQLQFNTGRGSATLRVAFDAGEKQLIVHTFQMCILVLYNQKDSFTFKEILDVTGIEKEELKRHVLSLAHPRVKILKKNPDNKTIADDHTFTLNRHYKNKLYRVRVGVFQKKVMKEGDQKKISKNVFESRKNQSEAAIVRIMKARKTLRHRELIQEVTHQLSQRFTPEPSFLKKRIESLIEREYLERDTNDRALYHYMA